MEKEIEGFYVPNSGKTSTKKTKKQQETKKSTSSQNQKETDYNKAKKREIEAIGLVKAYKEPAEANVIGAIYLKSDLLLDSKLSIEDFTYNHWRVYFTIANDLYRDQKTLSEDNIEFYLNQHSQLAEQYKLNKGYQTIERLKAVVYEKDFEGYLLEMRKWNAILKIAEKGFPIKDYLSEFADKTAEDIYNKYTAYLNDAFINVEEKVKSYNAFEGLHEFNDECDKGAEKGLDFCAFDSTAAEYLNAEVNGFNINGHIYGLGATSGMGKSTMAINYLFPTILITKQQAVFIINEEDQNKFKREAQTWVINNIILKKSEKKFSKKRFREGHFTDEEKEWLKEAADFLEGMANEHLITIIPLEQYTVNIAIKIIRKYAKFSKVRIFCLDTFKESCDSYKGETWKTMERDMRSLYDVIKNTALNVGLFVTYQLSKGSIKTRYLTSADIGQAKNIEDVMSVNLMIRRPFKDELSDGKNKLKYHPKALQGKGTVEEKVLLPNKRYMILFICKNRFGSTDPYQILMECDLDTNIFQEVGTCHVQQDF